MTWKEQKSIHIPPPCAPNYQVSNLKELTHLDHAILRTTIAHMTELHALLRKLAQKLNTLMSPVPTFFAPKEHYKTSRFLWLDIEHLKGSMITFLVFWSSTLLWIYINPPGGFLIVTLATGLSILTTFTTVKPSLLIVIFSFSFVFAAAMYVMVLPSLHHAWEIGLFIFGYAFIGFYFIDPKISVFFLLGTMTLGLANEMNYNFDVFLLTLFVFYAFLFLLLLFYYIPFSTKPEHLFLTMKKRFFTLSRMLLEKNIDIKNIHKTFMAKIATNYSAIHLAETVKKMQTWASKIDEKYFETLDKEALLAFTKECESFAYLLQMMYKRELQVHNNPLLVAFRENNNSFALANLLDEHASGKDVKEIAPFWKNEVAFALKVEERLEAFLADIKYDENELTAFYEAVSLRRNVWLTFLQCQKMMETLDFNVLERSRF
jgi:hypothetical protein